MGLVISNMSYKSPSVSRKPAGRLNGRGGSEPEVRDDTLDVTVIDRVQEYLKQISEITCKVPDQVQKSLITLYLTINNSMMTALESADSLIKVAQDKTKDQSPLINTALEQLTKATGELTKAAKRVQDLLEKCKDENETEGKEEDSKSRRVFSRFSMKKK